MQIDEQNPLMNKVVNGGAFKIFQTVAVIGDSLASGEFETFNENNEVVFTDNYWYSWGQFMARVCGNKVYNFSRGGMTAKEYMETFAKEKGFFNPELKAQAYIIALGLNDLSWMNQEVGSVQDDTQDTFARFYKEIIEFYRNLNPHAKFFLVTIPTQVRFSGLVEKFDMHQALLYEFAKKYDHTYVIDLRKYAPKYDEKFEEKYFLNGHMNALGYEWTSNMMLDYIDWIIQHHYKDFLKVGTIDEE